MKNGGILKQIFDILSPTEKRQIWLLLPLVILSAVLETAGVASIVPLLSLLSDPSSIERNRYLSWAYQTFQFSSRERFFFAAGFGILVLMTVSNTVSALSLWGLLRFSWMRNHTLSTRLLKKYLMQPYEFFLNRSSTDMSANILAEVQAVVSGVLLQGLQIAARAVSVVLICAALLVIDPWLALGVSGAFGGIYGGLYFAIRSRIARSGSVRIAMNKERFQVATEALNGVKELKLYGLEPVAISAFARPSREFAEKQANNAVVANIPRFALETIAFGGVLGMVLYLLHTGSNLNAVLPMIGLFVFAAYRLLPAVQTIFAGATAIKFNLVSLSVLHRDLVSEDVSQGSGMDVRQIQFRKKVAVEEVSFRYSASMQPVIRKVSISIAAGEWVSFVGPTGSGKSTLVDLLLGLLVPTEGRLKIDDAPLLDPITRRGWQTNVAYVPQQIFLLDDTIERNIAFGIPEGSIDRKCLEWAANVAQIDDFIQNELPAGYRTVIGERGIRLSGGQRQRIGVARALYRKPKFLVLDEATSALDNETEALFFQSLRKMLLDATVISIAHRLTTTRYFDRILIVEDGEIVDEGSFQELLKRSVRYKGVSLK